jgi:glycosyltransferase involved in cell wall biosynthesis
MSEDAARATSSVAGSTGRLIKVGLVTSVGRTLGFFPQIIETLETEGFAVSPASGTSSDLRNWTRLAGFHQRPHPSSPLGVLAVRRWARRRGLDVVVTNTATASAIVRAAGLPVPVVYFCHGLHWSDAQDGQATVWRSVERLLLRRTDGVITLNRDDEAWFRRRTDRPVHRLPYGVGVPLDEFPAAPVPAGPLSLLWAGDFSARKRPELALAVVQELLARGVEVELRMLGDGPRRAAVLGEVASRGLGSVVRAEGRGAVAPALASSTAVLHTASWEGLPRTVLEAAALGRWSYGFDVKGFRDAPLVRTAADGDPSGLAALIAEDHRTGRTGTVPDLREQLGSAAAARLIGAAIRGIVEGRAGR